MTGIKLVLLSAALVTLTLLDTASARHRPQCPPGTLIFNCFLNPCRFHTCPLFPDARCRPDYCGGCNARFFVGDTDVTDHCFVDNCEVEDGEDIECNGLCGVDPLSERPFCQPSCDFNNGGCSDEEVCVQGRIFCIRSPCPQPVNCIPKTILCNQQPDTESCGIEERAFFYNAARQRCQRFTYGGCEQSNNRFSSRRKCEQTCGGVVDACATVRCPAGTRCRVDVGSGQVFCDPSCEYENGGCEEDEICRMTSVQCVTTPCPDGVICHTREEVCTPEPDAGECRLQIPSYFFNSTEGRCGKFYYSGCGGNLNRFSLLEDCRETCLETLLPEDPCSLIDCAPGTRCRVNQLTGEGECVPDVNPCAFTLCLVGTQCRVNEITGEAECVPIVPANPCALCQVGTECVVDLLTGEAECVPVPCSLIDCAPGTRCRVNQLTGEGECVPDVNPCTFTLCLVGTQCRVNELTGEAECVPIENPCSLIDCVPGSGCRVNQLTGEVECVPIVLDNPCFLIDCAPGTRCQVNDLIGEADCVPAVNPCAFTLCQAGTLCRVNEITGEAECLPAATTNDPCASTLCQVGTQCRVNEVTGVAECVPATLASNPCAFTLCPGGSDCVINDLTGNAECTPIVPANPCALCQVGTECVVDLLTGEAECVPVVPHPCDDIKCEDDNICRVDRETGLGYCGIDPCTLVRCANCRYDEETDDALCLAPTDPCAFIECQLGTVCRVDEDTGNGVCVPFSLN